MFRIPLLIFSIALASVAGGLIFCFSRFDEKDILAYQELRASSKPDEESVHAHVEQKRGATSKEFWVKGEHLLHGWIESPHSRMHITRAGKDIHIWEEMDQVRCLVQERLFYEEGTMPMQEVHYLEADSATYDYSSKEFYAEGVALSKYQLEGHALPKSHPQKPPLWEGVAVSAQLSLEGSEPHLQASHFKATLESPL